MLQNYEYQNIIILFKIYESYVKVKKFKLILTPQIILTPLHIWSLNGWVVDLDKDLDNVIFKKNVI